MKTAGGNSSEKKGPIHYYSGMNAALDIAQTEMTKVQVCRGEKTDIKESRSRKVRKMPLSQKKKTFADALNKTGREHERIQ